MKKLKPFQVRRKGNKKFVQIMATSEKDAIVRFEEKIKPLGLFETIKITRIKK